MQLRQVKGLSDQIQNEIRPGQLSRSRHVKSQAKNQDQFQVHTIVQLRSGQHLTLIRHWILTQILIQTRTHQLKEDWAKVMEYRSKHP